MPRPILIFAVLGALLLAAGAVLLVGPGGPRPSTVVIPSPSASAVATPAVSPTPSVIPYPLPAGEPWILLRAGPTGGATLIRPDGTGNHEILGGNPDGSVVNPAWSPDGQRLAFEINGALGSHLWMANADGTGAKALTSVPDGCPEQLCTEDVHPAWSPDGRSIAFIAPTHSGGTFTRNALVVLDVATGGTTELYGTADAMLFRPSWSPDGRTIAVEIDRYSGATEDSPVVSSAIGLVDVAGPDHTPREVTDPALLAGYPTWHPADDLIVFRSNPFDSNTKTLLDNNAPSDIYTIHSDGSGQTAVTDNAVHGPIVRAPTWTSDGRIMFSKLADANAAEELRIIEPDGTGEASATGTVVTNGEGRWRPAT
jgi:Tol biopolymer transport system component